MADRTLNGFPPPPDVTSASPYLNAAYRDIRNKSGRVVAQFGPLQVFRRLNDAVIDQKSRPPHGTSPVQDAGFGLDVSPVVHRRRPMVRI